MKITKKLYTFHIDSPVLKTQRKWGITCEVVDIDATREAIMKGISLEENQRLVSAVKESDVWYGYYWAVFEVSVVTEDEPLTPKIATISMWSN